MSRSSEKRLFTVVSIIGNGLARIVHELRAYFLGDWRLRARHRWSLLHWSNRSEVTKALGRLNTDLLMDSEAVGVVSWLHRSRRPGVFFQTFKGLVANRVAPRVLELGSRRNSPLSLSRKHWVPHASLFLGVDISPGPGVHVVADAHQLASIFKAESFDIVISVATFEHLQYPWRVALEISEILTPGGLVCVSTHQTFPLHGSPHDYWRFSEQGLRTLFNDEAGFAVLATGYEHPCKVISWHNPSASTFGDGAYLLVWLVAEKQA